MKKLLMMMVLLGCSAMVYGQKIAAYTANDLSKRIAAKDTVYVVNFWATWCVPCVQELPEFNTLEQRYQDMPVKVLLVSLDTKQDYSYRLPFFLQRMRLTPEVVWYSGRSAKKLLSHIDKSWQGTIPVTLIVQQGKDFRRFIEGSVTTEDVSDIVDRLLQK